MADLLVGNDDCDIRAVVDTLFESQSRTGLIDNWRTIARDLGLHPTTLIELNMKWRNDESIEEILFLVLDTWVSAKGHEAKLSNLIKILRNPKYRTVNAADKLLIKFLGSDAAPSASSQKAPPAPNLEELRRQEMHIDRNLSFLTQWTEINVSLISSLVAQKIFTSEDVDTLDAMPNSNQKAMVFYRIIKTKNNFYHHLIAALEAGNQSGAVAILKSI